MPILYLHSRDTTNLELVLTTSNLQSEADLILTRIGISQTEM